MEFQYDLRRIARDQIVKIDNSLLPVGYQNPNDSELVHIIIIIIVIQYVLPLACIITLILLTDWRITPT